MKNDAFELLVDQIQESLKYNKDYAEQYGRYLNNQCLSIYYKEEYKK